MSIWSGWIVPGTLCDFGLVHPLPGIVSGLRTNTAVTLPVGAGALRSLRPGHMSQPDGCCAARLPATSMRRVGAGQVDTQEGALLVAHLYLLDRRPSCPDRPASVLVIRVPS